MKIYSIYFLKTHFYLKQKNVKRKVAKSNNRDYRDYFFQDEKSGEIIGWQEKLNQKDK